MLLRLSGNALKPSHTRAIHSPAILRWGILLSPVMAKRKASAVVAAASDTVPPTLPPQYETANPRPTKKTRIAAPPAVATNGVTRRSSKRAAASESTNPDDNPEILDGPNALRASPDGDLNEKLAPGPIKDEIESESSLSDAPAEVEPLKKRKTPAPKPRAKKGEVILGKEGQDLEVTTNKGAAKSKKASHMDEDLNSRDPEAEGEEEEAGEEEIKEALSRPPPVNSDYLPLPWKGRLGYVSRRA